MAGHDGYTRYTVRIPDALYERVKAAAGEKSVNAEIVATLEEKYPAPPEPEADPARITAIGAEISKNAAEISKLSRLIISANDDAEYDELEYRIRLLVNRNDSLVVELNEIHHQLPPTPDE